MRIGSNELNNTLSPDDSRPSFIRALCDPKQHYPRRKDVIIEATADSQPEYSWETIVTNTGLSVADKEAGHVVVVRQHTVLTNLPLFEDFSKSGFGSTLWGNILPHKVARR